MKSAWIAAAALAAFSAACHTTPVPQPAVPPVTAVPTAMPGPFDYTEKPAAEAGWIKKRVAVARFDDNIPVEKSPFGARRRVEIVGEDLHVRSEEVLPEKTYVPAQFTEKLIDALSRTGRFVLVERKDVNAILRELSFTETKFVDKEKSAKVGQLLGAQVIVTGAMGLNDDPASNRSDPLLLLLRMYDVETSRIVGTARTTGTTVQEVIDRAADEIAMRMDQVPWTGKIASVVGAKAYLNAGAIDNVKMGDRFKLFSLGRPISDPETKERIGYEEEPAGEGEVVAVSERVATLKVTGAGRLKVGDKAQLLP